MSITYPANFTQCTTRGSFGRRWQETAYNMFTFSCLFLLPLLIMIVCYSRIFLRISRRVAKKSRKSAPAPVSRGRERKLPAAPTAGKNRPGVPLVAGCGEDERLRPRY